MSRRTTAQAYRVFARLLRVLGCGAAGAPAGRAPRRARSTARPRGTCCCRQNKRGVKVRTHKGGAAARRAAALLLALLVPLVLLARPAAFTVLWLVDGAGDPLMAGALCFLWMVPVQYAQAWRYLSTDHIDSHWMRCYGEDHPWFGIQDDSDSEETRQAWFGIRGGRTGTPRAWRALRESFSSYVPLFSFALLLLGSTLLACLMSDTQLGQSYILFFGPHFAGCTSPALRVLGRALAIFDTVFGRVAQLLNVGVFLLVFCHHLEDMAHLIDLFELRHAFSFPKTLDRVAETQACLAHARGTCTGSSPAPRSWAGWAWRCAFAKHTT